MNIFSSLHPASSKLIATLQDSLDLFRTHQNCWEDVSSVCFGLFGVHEVPGNRLLSFLSVNHMQDSACTVCLKQSMRHVWRRDSVVWFQISSENSVVTCPTNRVLAHVFTRPPAYRSIPAWILLKKERKFQTVQISLSIVLQRIHTNGCFWCFIDNALYASFLHGSWKRSQFKEGFRCTFSWS